MSTVPSITASSIQLPPVKTHSSLWNTRTVIVGLIGVALLYLVYRFFKEGESSQQEGLPRISPLPVEEKKKIDLSKRIIHDLFPEAANGKQRLPFSQHAAGIIRVNAEDILPPYLGAAIHTIFLRCSYKEKTFFCQPMTRASSSSAPFEVFIPEMPFNEEITIEFFHERTTDRVTNLKVDQEMGIYEIIQSDQLGAQSECQSFPQLEGPLTKPTSPEDADNPLSVTIDHIGRPHFVSPRPVKPESYYVIENRSHKVHVLFFEIAGRYPLVSLEDQRLVIPIVVLPGDTKKLPKWFLRTCWEGAYEVTHHIPPPINPNLDLISIGNTTL